MATCPICAKPSASDRARNPAFPFCSARCKMVDLGKWLNEEYRVPVEEEDRDGESVLKATKNGDGDGEA